jgi:hypothetical protein
MQKIPLADITSFYFPERQFSLPFKGVSEYNECIKIRNLKDILLGDCVWQRFGFGSCNQVQF